MMQTLAKAPRSAISEPLTAATIAAELVHVDRSFGGKPVLRDISLKIHPGKTLVLIGESGCGKSVTTKLLAGLLEPDSGDVLWEGRSIRHRSAGQLQRDRLRLGYLFQGAALFDSLSVFENIAFGLRENRSVPESQIQTIVYDRLREVGLAANIGSQRTSELSGGMRKRVGLARALAMSPEMMIYDEPTTGLDPVMSGVIDELILQTQEQRHVTSVVVTHDMTTVRRVADHVIMLYPLSQLESDEPQIVFNGSRDELLASEDPRVARFIRGEFAGENSGRFVTT